MKTPEQREAEFHKWRLEQKHLPEFMRDFHDCKDLFAGISQYIVCDEGHPANNLSWVDAHCYTVDVFLWFMAEHGYTLQRNRSRYEFSDLQQRLTSLKNERRKNFASLLPTKKVVPK